MIEGIDVVFVHVKDPIVMSKWYSNTLGLQIGLQTPDLSWQEFQFKSDRPPTRFALDHPGPKPSEVERQRILVSFKVSDIHNTVKELEAKGVIFFGDPKIQDAGPSLFAAFQDPEGNWLQISQRKQLEQ